MKTPQMHIRLAAAGALAAAISAAAPIELFVSPAGDDANPGTRAKPLATPMGARDALRKALDYRAENVAGLMD